MKFKCIKNVVMEDTNEIAKKEPSLLNEVIQDRVKLKVKTKYYIGQPLQLINSFQHDVRLVTGGPVDGLDLVLADQYLVNTTEVTPAPNLPNVWYQWDGGAKPPCDPGQDVLVQLADGDIFMDPAGLLNWEHVNDSHRYGNIEWYMIVKPVEVIK